MSSKINFNNKKNKGAIWNVLFLVIVTAILVVALLGMASGWAGEEAKRKERYECINDYHTFCEEWSKFLFDNANKPKWWRNIEDKCKKVDILEPTREGCESISKVR